MSSAYGPRRTQYYAVFEDTIAGGSPRTATSYIKARYKILGLVYKKHDVYTLASSEIVPWVTAFRPAVTLGELNRGMRMSMRVEPPLPLAPKKVFMKQEGVPPTLVVYWKTRSSLWYEAQHQWIPVIGCTDPSVFAGNYLYQVEGDTKEECSARQVIQMTERMRIQSASGAGPEESLPIEWTLEAPRVPPRIPPHQLPVERVDDELMEAIRRSLEPVARSTPLLPTAPAPAPVPAPFPSLAPAPARVQVPPAPPAPPAFAPRYVLELLERDAIQKGESCPISMTPFQECTSTTATSCFHLFETAAIQMWLLGHTTCPVCKQHVHSSVVV